MFVALKRFNNYFGGNKLLFYFRSIKFICYFNTYILTFAIICVFSLYLNDYLKSIILIS